MKAEWQNVGGLDGTSSLYFIGKHFSHGLVILPDAHSLLEAKTTLEFFLKHQQKDGRVLDFPCYERGFEPVREDPQITFDRIHSLDTLTKQDPKNPLFVLTNLTALSQKTFSPRVLEKARLVLKKQEWADRDELISKLRQIGYRQDDLASDPGFYSVRGHLLDVYTPYDESPIRIEFFGDEIVSLRFFDLDTQRSLKEVDLIEILPCREIILNQKRLERAQTEIKNLADERQIDREVRLRLIHDIENQREIIGERWLLPAFYENLVSLEAYIRADLPPIYVDKERCFRDLKKAWQSEDRDFTELDRIAFGPGLLRDPLKTLKTAPSYEVSSVLQAGAVNYKVMAHPTLRAALIRSRNFLPLEKLVRELSERDIRTYLVVNNEKRKAAIYESFQDSRDLRYEFIEGPPFESFSSETLGCAFITERDIFGVRKSRSSIANVTAQNFLKQFSELKDGDLIIHEDHGVGRFRGLVQLDVQNVASEFLLLEYADEDKLYLPVYYIDKISRFMGDAGESAKLDRLGSTHFKKRKSKAKKDILRIAHELLELAAKRKLETLERPEIDENLYLEFCQNFPYELTAGQEKAILDIEKDLQRDRPMDRLVCGDVGFGKTEVALRAAMLCLLSGKQVALLAPTTLLVEQHFQNFKKRFQDFPFEVAHLSRFRSPKQIKETIEQIKDGRVGLVIGTHRLLQNDIQIKNLGLLIIDEEQRFGVKHKEKIKSLRGGCDVLTLSATPIPRTLQLSIVGVRDLSVIATPPDTREAVKTFVATYDRELIQKACAREKERGGQVFFIHNRVKTIDKVAERIRESLPDYQISVAHGQMQERELESKVSNFMSQKADVLVATSIIENGIDMPNVNTLFVDHAEQFGLSDLYQLRGRVGRSHRSSYAYFLIHEETPLTEEASKRLQVIQNCSELGSGFRVATHDLEIRGGGNILGEEQSGIITEIGLELYNQMLQETLEEIKDGRPTQPLPELNSGFPAYIPEAYIPDPSVRISTYKRLNRLRSPKDLLNYEEELLDRFGLFPLEVENLCSLQKLRAMALPLAALLIEAYPGRLSITLAPQTPLQPQKVIQELSDLFKFDPKGRLVYRFEASTEGENPAEADLKRMIESIKRLAKSGGIHFEEV